MGGKFCLLKNFLNWSYSCFRAKSRCDFSGGVFCTLMEVLLFKCGGFFQTKSGSPTLFFFFMLEALFFIELNPFNHCLIAIHAPSCHQIKPRILWL